VSRWSGARLVVRALEDEDVPFAFGIPGTHNIELYDALADSDRVRPVLVTDEQSASFMADGVWRASGRLACVNVVPGAGLTHALSGIAEAYLDTVPMLVLACGVRRDLDKAYQLHDVDQLAIARPVTKAQFRVERGEEIYPTVRRACRLARAGAPGPVLVEVPVNLYLFRHDAAPDPRAWGPPEPPPVPRAADVERAAEILNAARRPLLYVGAGALPAADRLSELAERLESPVATTLQGKGVFPETHPLWLWPGFGDAAPPFARAIARDCDATLAIGCRFSEVGTGSYGLRPPLPLVHADIDERALGRNVPAAVAAHADAGTFVAALLERLAPKPRDPALRERIRRGHEETWREMTSGGRGPGVRPARLLRALQQRFGPDAIYTADSGNGTFLAAEILRLPGPRRFLAPVDYSCMGYAVPAAIGAKLARPDAPVVALAGDGAFLMTGLECLTAAHLGVAIAVVVLRDRELAQIAHFQEMALGRKTASELPDYDLAALCRGMGVECLPVRSDEDVDAALAQAAEITGTGRPVALDVAIDYSQKTYFTRGVVKTNWLRLPWPERLRFVARALGRQLFPAGARSG
jgi:acetolactate synthase-1/2/3 large subunit